MNKKKLTIEALFVPALILLVVGLAVFSPDVSAQSDSEASKQEHMEERAKKLVENLKLLETDHQITLRALEAAKQVRSQGIAELARALSPQVRKTLGVEEGEAVNRTNPLETTYSSFRAILFASSSIPIHTLRRYAAQLDKIGGVMVFRGAPGGLSALTPMVKLTTDIIKHDPGCMRDDCKVWNVGVLIDPLLFRSHHISKVPAVMIVDEDPFKAYCERPDTSGDMAGGDLTSPVITYGDAHISGHLDALSRLGDTRADELLQQFFKQEETH